MVFNVGRPITGRPRTIRVIAPERRSSMTVYGTPPPPPSATIPLAQLGVPVPYMIGRTRVFTPNTMLAGNIRAITEVQRKFLGTEQKTYMWDYNFPGIENVDVWEETTVITGYQVSIQLSLCLGPGVVLRKIFADNVEIWSGTVGPARTEFSVSGVGNMVFSGGNFNQVGDPMFADLPFNNGYPGIAYITIKDYVASSPWPRYSFEVERFPNPLGLPAGTNRIGDDINVATAIADYASSDWGGCGVGMNNIDIPNFVAAAQILAAEGNGCSLYLPRETMGNNIINALREQGALIVIQNPSTGLIQLKPLRFSLFNPLTAIHLTDREITKIRNSSKNSWALTTNKLRLSFTNRAKNYEEDSVLGYNYNAAFGNTRPNRPNTIDMPAVMVPDNAAKIAARELASISAPILSFTVEANRRAAPLLPGDPLLITHKKNEIYGFPVFASKVRKSGLSQNNVIVDVEQLRGDQPVTFGEPEESLAPVIATDAITPSTVRILTAPFWLARQKGANLSAAIGSQIVFPVFLPTPANNLQATFAVDVNNYPGAGVFPLLDSGSYPTVGTLSAAISRYDGFANGIITSITLTNVVNPVLLLTNPGNTGVKQGHRFLFIGNEIFSFETVTDNGGGSYTLNTVHRALLDTVPVDHAANSPAHIVGSGNDYTSPITFGYPLSYTPQFAIRSQNIAGEKSSALISTAWPATFNRTRAPLRPHRTRLGGTRNATPNEYARGASITVSWLRRSRNVATVTLTNDASETPETDSADANPIYRVYFRSSANVVYSLGTVDGVNLGVNIPTNAAFGLGAIYVRTEASYGNSQFFDEVPVMITTGLESGITLDWSLD